MDKGDESLYVPTKEHRAFEGWWEREMQNPKGGMMADAGYLIYELPMGGGWLVFPADGDCADYEQATLAEALECVWDDCECEGPEFSADVKIYRYTRPGQTVRVRAGRVRAVDDGTNTGRQGDD